MKELLWFLRQFCFIVRDAHPQSFHVAGTIAQLEKSVKTARAGSTISGVPPPRPSITAPVGNNNNSNNGEENEAERRASVNFSARDLTLLRQKKKQEEAAAAKARYVYSVGCQYTGLQSIAFVLIFLLRHGLTFYLLFSSFLRVSRTVPLSKVWP